MNKMQTEPMTAAQTVETVEPKRRNLKCLDGRHPARGRWTHERRLLFAITERLCLRSSGKG